jgi:hypothetical protein
MADDDGYPTEDEIARIKTWPYEDPRGWFAFIKSAGNYWPGESWGWDERDDHDEIDKDVHVYEISTGGWSGNEEILGAMRANTMLWMMTWHVSRRGGHYTFMVKR